MKRPRYKITDNRGHYQKPPTQNFKTIESATRLLVITTL